MTQQQIKLNPNRLVQFLQKPMKEFTKADILKVIEEFEIEMINFRYMANDGRLKTLNFVTTASSMPTRSSPQVSAWTAPAFSPSSRQAAATFMSFLVSAQRSSTPSPRFLRSISSAISTPRTAHLSTWLPNTRSTRQVRLSAKLLAAWSSR